MPSVTLPKQRDSITHFIIRMKGQCNLISFLSSARICKIFLKNKASQCRRTLRFASSLNKSITHNYRNQLRHWKLRWKPTLKGMYNILQQKIFSAHLILSCHNMYPGTGVLVMSVQEPSILGTSLIISLFKIQTIRRSLTKGRTMEWN